MVMRYVLAGASMGSTVVRLGDVPGFIGEAELGAVGVCGVPFDDPAGSLSITGWQTFHVDESSGPVGQQRLWTGYIADRQYARAPGTSLVTGAERRIDCTLADLNTILSFRLFPESDTTANRPAETDIQRITWLLGTSYISQVYSLGFISSSGPIAMDAADLRGQSAQSTLTDCADASGKNYFLYYDEAALKIGLFYDFDYSAVFDCTLKLSNVLSDIDNSTTFMIEPDATLEVDPGRVYAGVQVPYSGTGSPVYVQNLATVATFGVLRDTTAPNVNVKTAAKANTLGQRYLLSIATEEQKITTTVKLPANKVTLMREGMRVQFKASHFPYGLNAFTWCRILRREAKQDELTPDLYQVVLELSPPVQPAPAFCSNGATAGGTYGPNLSATTNSDGLIFYTRPGLVFPHVPTPGFVGGWNFPSYNSGGIDYAGDCVGNHVIIVVAGNGTATVPVLFGGGATGHTWQASQIYIDPVSGVQTVAQTITGNVGNPVVMTITNWSQIGGPCYSWIDISEGAGPCGSNWAGFDGFTWVPA
jgi:hypothetical protein